MQLKIVYSEFEVSAKLFLKVICKSVVIKLLMSP